MIIERKNQTFQKIDFLGRVVGRFKNLQNFLMKLVALQFVLLFLAMLELQISQKVTCTTEYPGYYTWSSQTNSFDKTCLSLPSDARSLKLDFISAKPSERWVTHSQSGQDMLMLTIFNDMENGYFIDLAANDWKHISNSYLLEGFNNWKGVCIEPNPMYIVGLLSNRKCKIFTNPVGQKNGETVTFNLGAANGGIVGNEFDNVQEKPGDTTFETVTLTTILDFVSAPTKIQYLSLDVEGAEYIAMKGFNFEKYTIYAMTVERPKGKLHALLTKNGFVFIYMFSHFGECLYLHHSLPNFEAMLKKFHQDTVPEWNEKKHEYLRLPKWDANITEYLNKAEKIYLEHHDTSV
jgi:FkbM family methyltransferase